MRSNGIQKNCRGQLIFNEYKMGSMKKAVV